MESQVRLVWWATLNVLLCLAIPSQVEIDALLSLKQLSGQSESFFSSWTQGNSLFVCNWSGVSCNQAQTHVTELRLNGTRLQGKLPDQFGNLSSVQVLSLGMNGFQGSFPDILGQWTKLEWIDLSDNNFTGFPPSLEAAQNLRVLSLRKNSFEGELPDWLWNLSKLSVLDLSGNKFEGTIPPQAFALLNGFKHYVSPPMNIGDPVVGIYFNIKGRLNRYKSISTEFTLLDVSHNILTGELPSDLGSLPLLRFLNLSRNSFSGGIPDELEHLYQLEMLDVSHNQLSQSIPSTLRNLSTLASFDVSFNNLTGRIPDGGQLPTFEASSYQGNPGLCGIPLPKPCGFTPAPFGAPVSPPYAPAWWVVALALGFVIGYGGVVWMVVLSDSAWNYTFLNN